MPLVVDRPFFVLGHGLQPSNLVGDLATPEERLENKLVPGREYLGDLLLDQLLQRGIVDGRPGRRWDYLYLRPV